MNPLLSDWHTPFEIPPFADITTDDFGPAFEAALAEGRANSAAIASNPAAPSFANTIEALERADKLLDRVAGVFYNVASADSSPELEALQRDLSPKMAAYQSELLMNPVLYARVAALTDDGLTDGQVRVLTLYKKMFVRAGAELTGPARDRLAEIMSALASKGTAFTQNLLADERTWFMELDADGLAGLPDDLVASAKAAAQDRDIDGHIITTSRSLIVPFLQFSTRRDLREIAYQAWTSRGANGGKTDNRGLATEMLALRNERAKLLGYADFASFKLDGEMAKTPERVRELLNAVWQPARKSAEQDAEKLADLMHADGINGDLTPWDWRFYAAILQQKEHDLDDAEVKPYLELDRMINAAFDVASKLFGLSFKPLDVALYHPDARAWEVLKNGTHLGVFIGDYFARPSKRSGAWCSRFRGQSRMDADVRPITVNVCNFAKPPKGSPALLGFDDVRTLFHEFGHALHSLMSDVTYGFIAGTSVARDFVELPSQLYEHWGAHPQVLGKHALHVETNEPMPQDLLDRLKAAENFDSGFTTVEFIASAMVDLDFHTGTTPDDAMITQAETLTRLGMPNAIRMRHATPNFAHVFSGDGYAAGYYSYMWSEVMDADAFDAFNEAGDIFDPETAARLAKYIYTAGGSKDPEELYVAFRGALPNADALLRGRGLSRDKE
ncbi:MAG: M3 family metallopeptidase [Rhodobacteraceae bacterium]|nr:M3 family metallopeptidase [Paracoccaceae bacterium]